MIAHVWRMYVHLTNDLVCVKLHLVLPFGIYMQNGRFSTTIQEIGITIEPNTFHRMVVDTPNLRWRHNIINIVFTKAEMKICPMNTLYLQKTSRPFSLKSWIHIRLLWEYILLIVKKKAVFDMFHLLNIIRSDLVVLNHRIYAK